jgi:enoyl-CoA hydratase/carnithine racemase
MNHFPASVELSIDGAVATITLNIPERHNSLAGEDIDLFRQHLTAVEGNSDLRVLIVTGAGEKTFCPGCRCGLLSPITPSGGAGRISGGCQSSGTSSLHSRVA